MHHGDLEHLDAVAGEDVAAVAVGLLLIRFAGFQEDRGRRNPVGRQGHVTGEERQPRHRGKICRRQQHCQSRNQPKNGHPKVRKTINQTTSYGR